MIRLQARRHILPPPRVKSADWLQHHVSMPAGTETGGMPFSLSAFPHVDGPLAAFDDPSVRIIVLKWGTRLGKTTTCLSLMAQVAGTNPRNMMIAGPTQDAVSRVVSSRLYPILAATEGVKHQLLPEHRRSKLDVRLSSCRIFVGWSGSAQSLADVGAFFGHAFEIDKFNQGESIEADPVALFLNRFKGFTNHKIILESTPTIKGHSRIEDWLHRSNQHLRYVPCPHCGEYQTLIKGREGVPGGIKWERDAHGNSDADLAYKTAYYQCVCCEKRIENHHRVPMLRLGKWVPDGCTVNLDGQIVGEAVKKGSEVVGFGPLASWYSLTETWGSFARAWIRAKKRPRDLQDVVNSYLAETWEARKTKSTPEKIAERITGDTPRAIVPRGGLFVTVTVDRQGADGGFNPWVVLAHGAEDRAWEIDHGKSATLDDVWSLVMRREYRHADGGLPVTPLINAVDSGWDTKTTYDFCSSRLGVLACKGTTGDLGGLPYKLVTFDESNRLRTDAEGQMLFHVNTDFWEGDLQHRLEERLANEPYSLTLCEESGHDLEFMNQLCNGILKDAIDARGNACLKWIKKEESKPNDWRDCIRYGLALGRAWIDSEGLPLRNVVPSNPVPVVPAAPSFVRSPVVQVRDGGWIRRRGR